MAATPDTAKTIVYVVMGTAAVVVIPIVVLALAMGNSHF
jgi:hypothetical protein